MYDKNNSDCTLVACSSGKNEIWKFFMSPKIKRKFLLCLGT